MPSRKLTQAEKDASKAKREQNVKAKNMAFRLSELRMHYLFWQEAPGFSHGEDVKLPIPHIFLRLENTFGVDGSKKLGSLK